MTNKITIIFSLIILAIFFVAGCTKTAVEPAPEEKGDETISEISEDISDIDVMDDDLDTNDLDNLAQDLNDLDW